MISGRCSVTLSDCMQFIGHKQSSRAPKWGSVWLGTDQSDCMYGLEEDTDLQMSSRHGANSQVMIHDHMLKS